MYCERKQQETFLLQQQLQILAESYGRMQANVDYYTESYNLVCTEAQDRVNLSFTRYRPFAIYYILFFGGNNDVLELCISQNLDLILRTLGTSMIKSTSACRTACKIPKLNVV